ncbi:glycoside hydrolase family 76 protein [Cercospora zeae-maydis SCOH1-5]|uniref:Mannan endo-1,6-alpha-mannosidase n=1 Tax=Cercospora zeae-maydis SCOH1-5 TaxID=717836 RepID=A0A6A6F1A6_9PEZI|nr:glycoside hydrolase family 76 protein [Cercospora zeae-maydis SCOH1-5]
MRRSLQAVAGALAVSRLASAIQVTVGDVNSIKSAAKTIATEMVGYYHGADPGLIPGELGDPYYWWETGGMFNVLIDYWYYTGDTQFNAITQQGLLFQTGPDDNYMPPNQTKDEGNDDQFFWGCAAMTAAELNFQNPPSGQTGWLGLAQGVFNSQAARWDSADCGGGLRWQIFTWNNGYDYKNTASNGGLFNLAARLGAYTGNNTYFQWADKAWNWMDDIGLIGPNYDIFDGTSITDNCTSLDHTLWTYTAGMMLYGASVMWNQTTADASVSSVSADVWKTRAQNIWNATTRNYFTGTNNMIMQEVCEPPMKCDTDQQSFKAYLSRFMAVSTQYAPWLYNQVRPYIEANAVAAGQQCSGGNSGTSCGLQWTKGATYDGTTGVGEQMAALEIIGALMITEVPAPVSSKTGGTSQGDPDAGTGGDKNPAAPKQPITTADRVGAAILTFLALAGTVGGS